MSPNRHRPTPRPGRRALMRLGSVCWVLLCLASVLEAKPDQPPVLRFGFSRSMFREMNEADTRAAVKTYSTVIASDHSIAVAETPGIFIDTEGISKALAEGTADIVSMGTEEFLQLPPHTLRRELLASSMGGQAAERYVLLVRADANIAGVADLKDRRLIVFDRIRGGMGSVWLEVTLAERGLGAPEKHFSAIDPVARISRAVLPVFFNQADACLVTQRGFLTLGELNPQVLKQLRAIETSPEYVPHVTAMRAALSDEVAARIIKATLAAQYSVAGQQVLTIFQCDGISLLPPEALVSARTLLTVRNRLRAERKLTAATAAPPPPVP